MNGQVKRKHRPSNRIHLRHNDVIIVPEEGNKKEKGEVLIKVRILGRELPDKTMQKLEAMVTDLGNEAWKALSE